MKTYKWLTDTGKNCSKSLAIREIQIKTTLRYHATPVRMAKIDKAGNNNIGEDMEKGEPSYTVGRNASWYSCSGKQYEAPQEVKNRATL